ncbi:MAG: ADP-ribosylglycohydrolase family protein [Bacteroidota bacterium]|nr:ADP-ribosylglycohydrolase family protein [Bacteroidota bacterium]
MKPRIIYCLAIIFLLFSSKGQLKAQNTSEKKMITLPAELVVDKIRGGMLGMMIGNMNGWPYEFKFYGKYGDVKTYVPALPEGAQTDDDTDFEWVYIYNMQKTRNAYLPYTDINAYWKTSINDGIWCANRYARYLMDLGIQAPMTGSVVLNPWAEFNVSGQFICESFGLIAPAMPQTAAKIGLHYTKVAIDNEPAQTTQLFTTMISTAFVQSDINKILDAGVASLDPNSIIIQVISDVRKWHIQNPDNPAEILRLLHEKYVLNDELVRNQNGSVLNTGVIIASFLYGNGNFSETIRHSMNFGYDADCNAATLGTLMGTIYGHRRILNEGWNIVNRYKNTKRANMPMDETIISFADRVVDVFEMVNQENGGSKTVENNTVVYKISSEKPASVYKLLNLDEEKLRLKNEVEKDIASNLLSGKKQEMAQAAYLAVSLDLTKDLKKKYPKQWKEACYNLSGYWKVIGNIFHSDGFKSLVQLKEKFSTAGFVPMVAAPKTEDIYKDMENWKDPKILYTIVKGNKKK